MQMPVWVKPGVWGAIIGAVGIMIVGFSAMGWTLGSTAEKSAQQRTESAVAAALTPFCVQSYLKQPDVAKKIAGLRDDNSWTRKDTIEKGGWATMPGHTEPSSGVAEACADALLKSKT